jgi:hypothetical protein
MSVGQEPDCDGKPMQSGDVCYVTITRGGSAVGSESVSYDEMVKRNKKAVPDSLLMGLPTVGLAAVGLLWALPALRADIRIPGRVSIPARPLVAHVQEPAVRRLTERFEQAGTLRLGDLKLSRDGVSDPSGDHLPWSDDWELSGVRTHNGKNHKVVIDAPDGQWLSAVVPNLPMAQAVLAVLAQRQVALEAVPVPEDALKLLRYFEHHQTLPRRDDLLSLTRDWLRAIREGAGQADADRLRQRAESLEEAGSAAFDLALMIRRWSSDART